MKIGVVGDVHASIHVELAEKARIKGNVYYSYIEMKRGSEVNGNLVHKTDVPQESAPEYLDTDNTDIAKAEA